jgi:hypothetical protein
MANGDSNPVTDAPQNAPQDAPQITADDLRSALGKLVVGSRGQQFVPPTPGQFDMFWPERYIGSRVGQAVDSFGHLLGQVAGEGPALTKQAWERGVSGNPMTTEEMVQPSADVARHIGELAYGLPGAPAGSLGTFISRKSPMWSEEDSILSMLHEKGMGMPSAEGWRKYGVSRNEFADLQPRGEISDENMRWIGRNQRVSSKAASIRGCAG